MRIIRNVSWIFTANLIVSLTKWLILVTVAKILTPDLVGVYSLALALSAPVTLFANMKLRSLYVTDEEYNFYNYLHARYILSALALLLLFLISLTLYPQYFYIIVLVGLIKIFDLQSDQYYSIPHKIGHMNLIGKLMIGKHVISISIFIATILISSNLAISLLAQLTFQILYLNFFEKRKIIVGYNIVKSSFHLINVKNIILIGLPLGFVQMIFSFNASYPRYLLEVYQSTEVLGYFSAIAYILTIGNMMMNAISQIFLPQLSRLIKTKEFRKFMNVIFLKLSIFSLILGLSLIIFSYTFGEVFLETVYGPKYANYVDILILMSIALSINFVSWNFDTALLAMRYISIQPKISVLVLIINLFLGYVLITRYGIYGATFTIIITNSVQLILRVLFLNYRLKNMRKNDYAIRD